MINLGTGQRSRSAISRYRLRRTRREGRVIRRRSAFVPFDNSEVDASSSRTIRWPGEFSGWQAMVSLEEGLRARRRGWERTSTYTTPERLSPLSRRARSSRSPCPDCAGTNGRYVKECLDTNWVSSVGAFVDRFESMAAAALGVATRGCDDERDGGPAYRADAGRRARRTTRWWFPTSPLSPPPTPPYLGRGPSSWMPSPRYWQMDPQKLRDFLRKGLHATRGRTLKNQRDRAPRGRPPSRPHPRPPLRHGPHLERGRRSSAFL